jgi:hypothetical protein
MGLPLLAVRKGSDPVLLMIDDGGDWIVWVFVAIFLLIAIGAALGITGVLK